MQLNQLLVCGEFFVKKGVAYLSVFMVVFIAILKVAYLMCNLISKLEREFYTSHKILIITVPFNSLLLGMWITSWSHFPLLELKLFPTRITSPW